MEKIVPAIVFWFIVLVTAGGSVMVVTARNILHAAFALTLTFLGVAALYVFLHADFVAAVQLIVYVGGILVLIMFAVMFSSNVQQDSAESGRSRLAIAVGAAGALAIFAALTILVQRLNQPLADANPHAGAAYQPTVSVSSVPGCPVYATLSKGDAKTIVVEGATPAPLTLKLTEDFQHVLERPVSISQTGPRSVVFTGAQGKQAAVTLAEDLPPGAFAGKRAGIGHYLMGQYLLPFEVISVLLLAALIGAVVIVRKELS